MTSLVFTDVTGAGKSGFGLTITVQNLFIQLLTPGPEVTIVGTGSTRRIHRACWVGLGFEGGGYPNDFVSWDTWMKWNNHYINVYPGFLAYADTIFYETTPGTHVYIEVDY